MSTTEFPPSDRATVAVEDTGTPLKHPMAVVRDATMTTDEKRSLLASWASDERGVTDRPSLRRLDNGCLVKIDDIFRALKCLDRSDALPNASVLGERLRRRQHVRTFGRLRRRDSDDDPPTPTPATVRPRPPVLEGAAAVAG